MLAACATLSRAPTPPLSERGLFLRVKRRLAREGLYLKTCREDSRGVDYLGRHYTVNDRNVVHDTHIDIQAFAQELGVV